VARAAAKDPEGKKRAPISDSTTEKTTWMLESFLFPKLGSRPIRGIVPMELLAELRKPEKRGFIETAHRTRSIASRVWRFAVATGRAERDITLDLRGALTPVVRENLAGLINPLDIGELLRAIDGYQGVGTTFYALKLAPLTFVRPGELRFAMWSEFDLDAADWRIPAARMKRLKPHIVPLARQTIELLKALKRLGHGSEYLFPSVRTLQRPISNNTVNAALRRLGYTGDQMTGHGFRTTASTSLNELGWDPELVELQLAHTDDDKVRGAYNHAKRIPERRQMMQAWADYLDTLRAGRGKLAECDPVVTQAA
jgi:integrase